MNGMSAEKSWEDTRTLPTTVGEASEMLRELAQPWIPGERIKRLIERAARCAGLSYWRCFDLWYRKARRLEIFEANALVEALEHKRKEATRNELHELRLRLVRLEAILAGKDTDFRR